MKWPKASGKAPKFFTGEFNDGGVRGRFMWVFKRIVFGKEGVAASSSTGNFYEGRNVENAEKLEEAHNFQFDQKLDPEAKILVVDKQFQGFLDIPNPSEGSSKVDSFERASFNSSPPRSGGSSPKTKSDCPVASDLGGGTGFKDQVIFLMGGQGCRV